MVMYYNDHTETKREQDMSHIINHFVIRNSFASLYWTAYGDKKWTDNIWFAKMYNTPSAAKRSSAYDPETTTVRIAELFQNEDGVVERKDKGIVT